MFTAFGKLTNHDSKYFIIFEPNSSYSIVVEPHAVYSHCRYKKHASKDVSRNIMRNYSKNHMNSTMTKTIDVLVNNYLSNISRICNSFVAFLRVEKEKKEVFTQIADGAKSH